MKSEKKIVQQITRRLAQTIVHRERIGWPPDSPWGCYQPRRPESPEQKVETKK